MYTSLLYGYGIQKNEEEERHRCTIRYLPYCGTLVLLNLAIFLFFAD